MVKFKSSFNKEFAYAVSKSLNESPKRLPTPFLFDSLGTAIAEAQLQLNPRFAKEKTIYEKHADELNRCGPFLTLIQLGSSCRQNCITLVNAMLFHQPAIEVVAIDTSVWALERSACEFNAIRNVHFTAVHGEIKHGLEQALKTKEGPKLIVFPAASVATLDSDDLNKVLAGIRRLMKPGDAILLGADLVGGTQAMKRGEVDELGLTTAFCLNGLNRINMDLGANFDTSSFTPKTVWNEQTKSMEVKLVSNANQRISIPEAGFSQWIEAGEEILVNVIQKYTAEEILARLRCNGFPVKAQWMDEDRVCAETLSVLPESSTLLFDIPKSQWLSFNRSGLSLLAA